MTCKSSFSHVSSFHQEHVVCSRRASKQVGVAINKSKVSEWISNYVIVLASMLQVNDGVA